MLRVILIDDELYSLKEIQHHLEQIANINIVGSYTNPIQGFFDIKTLKPDVIFLDIDMPEISGIYLAEQIISLYDNIRIIFVTAYDSYAINAFELNALDYILKPVAFDRIKKSIERLKQFNAHTNKQSIHSVSEKYEETIKKLFILDEEDTILISTDDIYYIEALNKDVQIRTKDAFLRSRYPLKYYINKVKNLNFFQVHRSYIINLDKVAKISPRINYSYDLYFNGITDFVPISRNNVKTIRQLLEL